MTLEIGLRLLSGVLLLLLNAFFVATEFALTRLRQYSAEEFEGDRLLERAWKMTETLEIYLTSCQIGITSTSIILGVVAEPGVTKLIQKMIVVETIGSFSSHSISIVLSLVIINFAHTVWGEQSPTYLGVERAKGVARLCALPLYVWTYTIYPILYFGDWLTKATLKIFGIKMQRSWTEGTETAEATHADVRSQVVDLLKSEGLPEDRRNEVVKALEIDEIPVSDIMVPRGDIIYLSDKKSLRENLETVRHRMQSRYPLVGDSLDDFKGVLYASEVLAHIEDLQSGETTLKELSRADMTVPQNMPVSELIDCFQQKHQELALVTENGKTTGLVTLTDALEVIVGSAEDPMDLEMRKGDGQE